MRALIAVLLVLGSQDKPEISIGSQIEEGKKVLVATVRLSGKPLEGVKVAFFAERTFGRLALGIQETLDDGTAAVPFPSDLPGGSTGELSIVVKLIEPPKLAGAERHAKLPGGLVVPEVEDPYPAALWSPVAPPVLVVTIAALLAVVWSFYLFVLYTLFKLRKEGLHA